MSKTKEELDELKEEVEKLDEKLHELTEEELAQVTGGVGGFRDREAISASWDNKAFMLDACSISHEETKSAFLDMAQVDVCLTR